MANNRNLIKRIILKTHKLGTKLGIHILPVHYYSPVPDILALKKTKEVWAKKSTLPGVAVNLDDQANSISAICLPYLQEYQGNKFFKEAVSSHFGPGYGYIEAQALHGFIRHYKPGKVVEVGSGVSTYCMLKAAELNAVETGHQTKIVSIEPYPSESLKALPGIELIPKQVQTVPLDVFTELGPNDLLFIDSSHTVKTGGDVNYLFLEVLPRLKKGVLVHIHDIYFPYDYQPDVCQSFLHWSETSLLRAFLTFNEKVKIVACLSHLHYDRPEVLKKVFPEYAPQPSENGLYSDQLKPFEPLPGHFPASVYLQYVG